MYTPQSHSVPSQTYYLRHGQMDYLDDCADEWGLANPSQALQRIVNDHMEDGNA